MSTPSKDRPTDAPAASAASGSGPGSPLGWLLDLFSSVRFGIVLMVLLFIYMSVGSAGVVYPVHPNLFMSASWEYQQLRQAPIFEMTEFEWFHWWPFDVLMGLIATTLIVTTLRRIRLSIVNLGVWMIHAGIIVLIIGSLIYFGTKVEGDTFLPRRSLVIEVLDESGEPIESGRRLGIFAGNTLTIDTPETRFEVLVASTDPDWELLTGDHAGERAYSVSVFVRTPETSFIRQVIDGHPDYTEDLVSSDDSEQPFQRAVKVTGEKIIEPRLRITMIYEAQDWIYLSNQLSKNWALYLREKGAKAWIERPIPGSTPLFSGGRGLPLYGDYVADPASVMVGSNRPLPASDPLDVSVAPVSPEDPLPGVTFSIDSYLRYAVEQSRWVPGSETSPVNPVIELQVAVPGMAPSRKELVASVPASSSIENGAILFKQVTSEDAFQRLDQPPAIRVRIPSMDIDETREVRKLMPLAQPWSVGDSGYQLVLSNVQDDIVFSSGMSSVAFVDINTPDGASFRRWVFDDPMLTRDLDDDGGAPMDQATPLREEAIEIEYLPGWGNALLTFVAGPEADRLRVIRLGTDGTSTITELKEGERIAFGGGVAIDIRRFLPRAVQKTAPLVVPEEQRQREAGNLLTWVRLDVPGQAPRWLQFQKYLFDDPTLRLQRYEFKPTLIRFEQPDGTVREVEAIFSRQRVPLPSELVLERFEIESNVGGFTGETGSIRDYRSLVRFDDGGTWSEPRPISMNKPVEHEGFWFFQSQWDPPEPARSNNDLESRGLNYTVLGVGNRNGVMIQLLGCGIAVVGMIYAFYIKPAIKRHRRRKVMELLEKEAT